MKVAGMQALRWTKRRGKKAELPWVNCDLGTAMAMMQIRGNKWHLLGYDQAINKVCAWRVENWRCLNGCQSVEEALAETVKIKASTSLKVGTLA